MRLHKSKERIRLFSFYLFSLLKTGVALSVFAVCDIMSAGRLSLHAMARAVMQDGLNMLPYFCKAATRGIRHTDQRTAGTAEPSCAKCPPQVRPELKF